MSNDNFKEIKNIEEIERCIVKRYKKHIWSKFLKAINDYKLIEDGDKIAIAISGGKDSLLMAKMFQELKKYSNIEFDIVFLAMDPGYRPDIRDRLDKICDYLNIDIQVFESDIFKITDEIARDNPCYMCARMRRGALYNKTEELGCNKLALGHHYDDVIETTMMNILCSGNFKTMLPKVKSSKNGDMQIIRPLYYIREEYIKRFIKYTGLEPLDCACTVTAKKAGNKRYEIKELISNLANSFENVEKSIFKSAQNVNIDSILGWEEEGIKHNFMEKFNNE